MPWVGWAGCYAFFWSAFTLLSVLSTFQDNRRIRRAAEDPTAALRQRIGRVQKAVTTAAREMDELERAVLAQQVAGEALITKAEVHGNLLAIDQEQAEKIRKILVGETKATIQTERRQQWMFFAAGLLLSIPIGVLVNLIS